MSNLKNEYNGMQASDELRERVGKIMAEKRKRRISPIKAVLGAAACFAVATVAVFNLSPGLAAAASDIPVIGDIVRVITFGRYEYSEGYYEANIITPKVEGLGNRELEDSINAMLKADAEKIIERFEADVAEFRRENGDAEIHWGVDSDYEIRTDNESIIVLDVRFTTTAATSTTVHKFYNIDKKNGELITLPSLFRDGADYITPISEYISAEMARQNETGDGMYWSEGDGVDYFTEIDANQKFYINSDGNIVIGFEKYEVAPGAAGNPEFEIPAHIVEGIRK